MPRGPRRSLVVMTSDPNRAELMNLFDGFLAERDRDGQQTSRGGRYAPYNGRGGFRGRRGTQRGGMNNRGGYSGGFQTGNFQSGNGHGRGGIQLPHNRHQPSEQVVGFQQRYGPNGEPVCYRCGGLGHIRRNCPMNGNDQNLHQNNVQASVRPDAQLAMVPATPALVVPVVNQAMPANPVGFEQQPIEQFGNGPIRNDNIDLNTPPISPMGELSVVYQSLSIEKEVDEIAHAVEKRIIGENGAVAKAIKRETLDQEQNTENNGEGAGTSQN